MNFWERVENLIEQKGINKKTLAAEAGIDSSNISKGLKSGGSPSADTAVRIAKFLDTSVEYLVTGNDAKSAPADSEAASPLHFLIQDLKTLGCTELNIIAAMVHALVKPLKSDL
jgi:transcriptional regulator with XRE-family HTH domain